MKYILIFRHFYFTIIDKYVFIMWLLLLYVGLMTGGNQYILHMSFIRAQRYCEGVQATMACYDGHS